MSTQQEEAAVFARRYLRRAHGRLTKQEARELGRLQAGGYSAGFFACDFLSFRTPGGFARDWRDASPRDRRSRLGDVRRGFPFAHYGELP